jgi:transcriptional regulator with GAF, ATPase, and Fis domain
VRQHAVQAVLCVPIAPVGGVLYLQGRDPFGADARDHALRVARRIAERVLLGHADTDRLGLHEAMRAFQRRHVLAALERNHWNASTVARELRVARVAQARQ